MSLSTVRTFGLILSIVPVNPFLMAKERHLLLHFLHGNNQAHRKRIFLLKVLDSDQYWTSPSAIIGTQRKTSFLLGTFSRLKRHSSSHLNQKLKQKQNKENSKHRGFSHLCEKKKHVEGFLNGTCYMSHSWRYATLKVLLLSNTKWRATEWPSKGSFLFPER